MSRLSIETPGRAQNVLDGLHRDMERRIGASAYGLCPVDMSLNYLRLCHAQTCGKCVPCRIGLGQLNQLIRDVLNGKATMDTLDLMEKTALSIMDSADCAIGYEAANMVYKGLIGYRDDYVEHIRNGRCTCTYNQPVPCVAICPAHVDIPGYVALVEEGRYADAIRLIRKDNPFPTTCGFICEHPCEARCRRNMVDEVFVHLSSQTNLPINKIIKELEVMGVTVDLNINVFEMEIPVQREIERIGNYYTVSFSPKIHSFKQIFFKRVMDIVGAIVGLLITGIVTVFLAPALLIESPGPLFFSQVRVGKNGRRFKIYKFRSMYMDAEERKKELMSQNEMEGLMFKMENDPRVTKVGKFIRKTSIDELPQFWNILKGEMSLVGTRPPTEDEFLQYEGYHRRRLNMTPGLTGLWQVSGRSDTKNFEEIVAMDVEYIDNWSLKEDIKILFKTVGVVLKGKGAS